MSGLLAALAHLVAALGAYGLLLILLMLAGSVIPAQMVGVVRRKVRRTREEALAARMRRRFGEPLIELLADEADEAARRHFLSLVASPGGAPLTRDERRAVADLVLGGLPKVRGEAHVGVRRLFVEGDLTAIYLDDARSRSARRRGLAAEALGELRLVEAIPALEVLIVDPAPEIRLIAARALSKQGVPLAAEALLTGLTRGAIPSGVATLSLLRLGAAAGPALTARLVDPRPEVRAIAVDLLGALRWRVNPDDVIALTQDAAVSVRAAAARTLGWLELDAAMPALLSLLAGDAEATVRAEAAQALGRIGDPKSAYALRLALRDAQRPVATVAANALLALGDAGLQALTLARQDTQGRASAYALETLQRSGHVASA